MRVINVIKIKDGVVDDMESYAVYEEQLVQDVVKPAEEMFIKCAREIGFDGDEDEILDNGYYESETENRSVCITWSYV